MHWLLLLPLLGQLPAEKEFTNSVGQKLLRVEPGEFRMGQGDAPPTSKEQWETRDHDEAPTHIVRISKPFYVGATEVTFKQFDAFDPTHRKSLGIAVQDEHPVTFVTWDKAAAFCEWLSKKEGRPYRLPTEAEWEYACRAGTTTIYSTGEAITLDQAHFSDPKKPTKLAKKVGSYPANPWGFHDMHGNVAEWCADWYGPYESGKQTDPVGRASGYARIARGWSFLPGGSKDPTKFLRSANRSGHLPQDANSYTGFRVALGERSATEPLPAVAERHQSNVSQSPAPQKGPEGPHFVNYAKSGQLSTIPKDAFGPIFSAHNHYAACAVCPNGDVLACWYTTVSESGRELSQAASRLRVGAKTWEPASLFFDVPDVNDHAPVLLTVGKRVFHFGTQSLKGWDNSSNFVRFSDDSGVTWSRPEIICKRTDALHLSQPCTAFSPDGTTIVVACDGDGHRDERVIVSRDFGKTWKVGQGDMRATVGAYAIHPAIAPVKDGMLAFLRGPHPMPMLFSKDLGETWTPRPLKFPGIGVGQKACALRLQSGALLLCSIDSKKELQGGGTYAALSDDDGVSWPHVKKIEGPTGYMSVAQGPNGTIHLVGSRMSAASFNEAYLRSK